MSNDTQRDAEHDPERPDEFVTDLSRRDFVALSLAAGVAVATGTAASAQMQVAEKDVEVKTADGSTA